MRTLGVNFVAVGKRATMCTLLIFVLGLRGQRRPLTFLGRHSANRRDSVGRHVGLTSGSTQSCHSGIGHVDGGQRDGGERDQPRGHIGSDCRRPEVREAFYSHYRTTTRMTVGGGADKCGGMASVVDVVVDG